MATKQLWQEENSKTLYIFCVIVRQGELITWRNAEYHTQQQQCRAAACGIRSIIRANRYHQKGNLTSRYNQREDFYTINKKSSSRASSYWHFQVDIESCFLERERSWPILLCHPPGRSTCPADGFYTMRMTRSVGLLAQQETIQVDGLEGLGDEELEMASVECPSLHSCWTKEIIELDHHLQKGLANQTGEPRLNPIILLSPFPPAADEWEKRYTRHCWPGPAQANYL